MFGLGKFLWRQGLKWLFLVTIAGITMAVFIALNLNNPFNLIFQAPTLIVMSIAATRMHRSLTDFADSGSQAFVTCRILKGRTTKTDPKQILAWPIPQNQVEVTLNKPPEDCPPANMGQYGQEYGPDPMNSQSQDKPLVLSVGNDIENGIKGQ